ncbi:MAG TPA: hypothetical protein V6D17_07385 [Candidatus Obscuribacterales bacterium]
MTQGKHSVQGGWRGRYFYAGDSTPHGFEAVFVEMNGIIEGNILDDDELGEATVGGKFTFPFIKFTKIYRSPGTQPVSYQGEMTEDGTTLTGRWTISSADVYGTWTAKRFEEGEDLKIEDLEQVELKVEVERPKVAPARERERSLKARKR